MTEHNATAFFRHVAQTRKTGSSWTYCDKGHRHWGPDGAAGLLIRHTDEQGTRRYLMQERAPWVDEGGTWSIPGGALEHGETPENGAHREASEELGHIPELKHHRTHTDDHGGWAYHTVIADAPHQFHPDSGDGEADSHQWMTGHEINQLAKNDELHSGFAATWKRLRRTEMPSKPRPKRTPSEHEQMSLFSKQTHTATTFFRQAASNNGWYQDPDHEHVARGMEISPEEGWHPDAVKRILNGTARHDDILKHVDTNHVGHYWWPHKIGDEGALLDPKSYAHPHEPIADWLHDAGPGENVFGDVGVVLVGHRPHGWNPDDNPDSGLMGNAYLPDNSHINVNEIHYNGDGSNTWHRIVPPAGTTVHTDGPQHTATTASQTAAETDTDNEGHQMELDPLDGSVSHDNGTTVPDHPVRSATAFFRQAEDHPGPFFHGTAHEFQPGDFVDPSYELGGRKGRSYAFMTSDPEVAHNYGKHKAWTQSMYGGRDIPGRAYEVRPTGPIEIDDAVDDRFKAWRTRHPLQIVREVTPQPKDSNGHDPRTAGRGKPRHQPGAEGGAAAQGADTAGAAPAVGTDQGGAGAVAPRQVSFHPAAKKELGKLDSTARKQIATTIDGLASGAEGLQTHALTGPLKGWNSTKASRGHRVIHKDMDDGTLHIGYVGLHEYGRAIKRLTSLTDYFRQASLQETASVDDGDYRIQHRAPGPEDAPMHDPTRPNGEGSAFHPDSLAHPEWGGIGVLHDETLNAMRSTKGNPDAPVTIYRAVPHGVRTIHAGDWVTPSAEYAHDTAIMSGSEGHYGEPDNPEFDWPVIKATVPAKHVHTDGNDINEWGYNGPHIENAEIHAPAEWGGPSHHNAARHSALLMTEARRRLLQRRAAAVAHDEGVMIALVPPPEVAQALTQHGGQPADQLHITLAYLGDMADYTPEQLALLPQIVGAWAVRHKPVRVCLNGVGKFNNESDGEHVLWAAADIPGGAQMHASLASYLEGHGYRLPSEHGWTPHLTLAYVGKHFRFMPNVDEQRWNAEEVVTFVGSSRHPARLFGRPSTPTTL